MQPSPSLEQPMKPTDVMADLEEIWFETAPPSSVRRSSAPPPPVEKLGEFLGDPDVDAWLR
jgi:hypothetical protein